MQHLRMVDIEACMGTLVETRMHHGSTSSSDRSSTAPYRPLRWKVRVDNVLCCRPSFANFINEATTMRTSIGAYLIERPIGNALRRRFITQGYRTARSRGSRRNPTRAGSPCRPPAQSAQKETCFRQAAQSHAACCWNSVTRIPSPRRPPRRRRPRTPPARRRPPRHQRTRRC